MGQQKAAVGGTVLVDTEGLPSVPWSFALAFAFLAASRFFFESDTICAKLLQSVCYLM